MLPLWPDGAPAPALVLATLFAALAIDALAGDPPWLYRRLSHPVAVLGRLTGWFDERLNRPDLPAAGRGRRGLALVALVVGPGAALGWLIGAALHGNSYGWPVEAALASTLLAGRGLRDHVAAVAVALDEGLEAGRAAVARIVGRDVGGLDRAGVARAAIESCAENFSDGVVAPAFWFALGGLPGLLAYKAINTLDSMVGHRNERYAAFGRAAARLDDAVNWLPARLAGGLIALAALAVPGARAGAAWRVMARDARRHRSPNAGWQEAAMAGALGLALAGPRHYGGRTVDDAWMGDGRTEATAGDVRRAIALYTVAWASLAALAGLGALVL